MNTKQFFIYVLKDHTYNIIK